MFAVRPSLSVFRRPLAYTRGQPHPPLTRSVATRLYHNGELIPSQISQSLYDEVSEHDMETLYENLEDLCESKGAPGWEVEYSAGVLNLSLPPHGTWVLNKQPPNQQIWMSSPLSGPCRFGYIAQETQGTWNHFRREGVTLGGLLEGEIRELCEKSAVGEGWEGCGIA